MIAFPRPPSPTSTAAEPSTRSPLRSSPQPGKPSSWPYPAPSPLRCAVTGGGGGGSTAAIRLSPERLVKKAGEMRAKEGGAAGTVLVVCVAANDVYVMRAWGEQLGAAAGGVMMLSDPEAQMARALGMALDPSGGAEGFGVRSDGYVIAAVNGMVRALFLNHYDGGTGDSATAVDDVPRVL
ncbi:hypothetical protein COCNU_11G004020 [Cocos nucifera]|uniref:glutaredoxin-dependent peroxiredoxin n=1 Tax=Cocos nucifera TaxID=13894 RepID=A0A8K0N9S7_COCNU|nr:hypothetical protein COCNU_11G004020 [Cocos nucifera]